MSVPEVQGVAQCLRDRREAFPSDVVDHVENLEVLAVGKLGMPIRRENSPPDCFLIRLIPATSVR